MTDESDGVCQVYMLKDRKFMEKLIERAKEARCSALVLTLDLQILGQRHNDIRNGLSAPPTINLDTVLQFLTKPSWHVTVFLGVHVPPPISNWVS